MRDIYKMLIGKRDKDGNILPLYIHLRDTIEVMKRLVSSWVSESTVNACKMQYEDFFKLAVFVAGTHDIGKAVSYFQYIINRDTQGKIEELNSAGIVVNREYLHKGKTPHAYAGQWILQSEELEFNISETIANIIGAHHGNPIDSSFGIDDLIKIYKMNYYGRENDEKQKRIWNAIWKEIFDNAIVAAELDLSADSLIYKDINLETQILITGLLIVADWIASNTAYFPLIEDGYEYSEEEYAERIEDGWSKVCFSFVGDNGILNMSEKTFYDRFSFYPNEVQKTIFDAVNKAENPGIFILEAPMGCGKTEAALGTAEVAMYKNKCNGIFFGLPTQVTSNGLFERLYKWASSISEDTLKSICLAHGGAEYNEDYYEQIMHGKSIIYGENDEYESGVLVHPWFQGNKRKLLSDYVIGTVDQFLMASLKRKHFMLRHLGLANKVVIIDECHAYDTYMNQYLDQSIEWMAYYGVTVILLSATLPIERRNDLIKRYLKGLNARKDKTSDEKRKKKSDTKQEWEINLRYPILTWTDEENVYQSDICLTKEVKRIVINKIYVKKNEDVLVKTLQDKLSDGGCACIIANTVKNAQKYYELVKKNFSDYNIILYHSQFTMSDRTKKEKIILDTLGKKSIDEDRNKTILIGTQVLEQSLDYDVDIMFTEVCPIDLLLQRIGRLQRHNRNDNSNHYSRPNKLKNPECFIICNEESQVYDDGSKVVYGEYLLMRTIELMPDIINIPTNISELVQGVYSDKLIDKLENSLEYAEAKEKHENNIREKDMRSKMYLLSLPKINKKIKSMKGMLSNEDIIAEKNVERSVRDTSNSIEVIVLKKHGENKVIAVNGSEKEYQFDINIIPDCKSGMQIIRQKMKLPSIFATSWNIQKTIEILEKRQIELKLWQQSPLIQGELVLLLDENGNTELCGYDLNYDFDKGLTYKRLEDKNG